MFFDIFGCVLLLFCCFYLHVKMCASKVSVFIECFSFFFCSNHLLSLGVTYNVWAGQI
jgi:multidrug transporter EmrE-like cation transporter